jgi:hypothetical protein
MLTAWKPHARNVSYSRAHMLGSVCPYVMHPAESAAGIIFFIGFFALLQRVEEGDASVQVCLSWRPTL